MSLIGPTITDDNGQRPLQSPQEMLQCTAAAQARSHVGWGLTSGGVIPISHGCILVMLLLMCLMLVWLCHVGVSVCRRCRSCWCILCMRGLCCRARLRRRCRLWGRCRRL